LRETVKGIVRLSFLTEETTESIGGERVGGTALSINISNVDLNGSVILGSDETVGGRATLRELISLISSNPHPFSRLCCYLPLAGDVKIDNLAFRVLHFCICDERERDYTLVESPTNR